MITDHSTVHHGPVHHEPVHHEPVHHGRLGRELKLFATDPLVGAGLPLWRPDGAVIRAELEKLAAEEAVRGGCQRVYTPVLAKRELYERSGHWAKFADDMFPPMKVGDDELVLRPANCPHHALVYAAEQRSFRDLPVRLAELGAMFRSELSGVLGGLSRVRQINLDDTHVFCALGQVQAEIARALASIARCYRLLGIEPARYRLSRRGPGAGFLGGEPLWADAERQLAANSAGCSSAEAICQKPMPDTAQSVPFWTSAAQAFKGNNAVIFDLFNEPYPERADNDNGTEGWRCWRSGGRDCVGISYSVAGMQTLVNAVRGTGASNVIMLGGLEYANDLTQWLKYEPADPDHNLVAAWHSYSFNACRTQSCWTSQVGPVIARVPVIAGEIGENDCADTYIDPLMAWLDSASTSYLAWAWNADFNCSSGPGLITDYGGDPTA